MLKSRNNLISTVSVSVTPICYCSSWWWAVLFLLHTQNACTCRQGNTQQGEKMNLCFVMEQAGQLVAAATTARFTNGSNTSKNNRNFVRNVKPSLEREQLNPRFMSGSHVCLNSRKFER